MEKVLYKGKDNEVKEISDFISHNALGNIIIATQQPSADTLKVNAVVFYDGYLYTKLVNGNSYKWAITSL